MNKNVTTALTNLITELSVDKSEKDTLKLFDDMLTSLQNQKKKYNDEVVNTWKKNFPIGSIWTGTTTNQRDAVFQIQDHDGNDRLPMRAVQLTPSVDSGHHHGGWWELDREGKWQSTINRNTNVILNMKVANSFRDLSRYAKQ